MKGQHESDFLDLFSDGAVLICRWDMKRDAGQGYMLAQIRNEMASLCVSALVPVMHGLATPYRVKT
jgi:hypothetical protein